MQKFPYSDFKESKSIQKLVSGMVIRLDGIPTPSSPKLFTIAYLVFLNEGDKFARPKVVARTNYWELQINYPISHLETVEKMLESPEDCHVWVGNFSNDFVVNYYADLHSGYRRPK